MLFSANSPAECMSKIFFNDYIDGYLIGNGILKCQYKG